MIVLAWVVLGTIGTSLIASVLTILNVVDGKTWSTFVMKIFFWPTALAFTVAGILFVNQLRRMAYGMAGLIVAAYVGLDLYVIISAIL
jgi:hypothetical protein